MNPAFRVIRAALLTLSLGFSLTLCATELAAHPLQAATQQFVRRNCQAHPTSAATGSPTEARPDIIIVEAPVVLPGSLTGRFPQGSRLVRLAPSAPTGTALTPDFFAAADPRISFDGARVLFAGKKSRDSNWQIWEMAVDGTGARQVTKCDDDCMQADYLAHDLIVYTAISNSHAAAPPGMSAEKRIAPISSHAASPAAEASQIWTCNLDGSDAHPITFGPGDFQVETVLKNGTILVTARTPLLPSDGRPTDRELYTIRLDGTSLATLRCDHQHPAIRSQARELDNGSVVFIKASLTTPSVGGQLAWIRRGALHNEPLTEPSVHAMSPQPIAGNEIIVARESAAGTQPGAKSSIYAFDAAAARFSAPLYQPAKLAVVEAVPVAAHQSPPWYWSTLNADLKRGYFICLNSYLAKDVPQGKISAKLAQVRVLTLDQATQKEKVLGEAPIEKDGSFYIAVPPDQPVRFETLDGSGRVVRAQRSWIWARSGDEHGCVGCHEDRAVAPENRWPIALQRFDTPTRLDVGKAGSR